MNKELEFILNEMCNRIGVDSKDVDFQTNEWYSKHTWTIHQEAEFLEWLSQHLYDNKEARILILQKNTKSKEKCKKAARIFLFNFGWAYKETETKEETN